jgi:hypothetical protein
MFLREPEAASTPAAPDGARPERARPLPAITTVTWEFL